MKFTSLILISLLITAISFAQSGQTETLTVPLSNPGKEYTLKVNLVIGSIKITGYDGKDIIINVSPGAGDEEDNESEPVQKGMKRISVQGGFEVTAKEADNTVTINTGIPNKILNLELKIPQGVKLNAGTVNEGEVVIENLKGELEVNNVNDNIRLSGISGSVVANTVNGDVTVEFKSIDPQASMAFSTLNGDINVSLPSDAKANLKLKSDYGEVLSDFDIDIEKTPAKIDKISEPGMYKIKKEEWVNGKINGGGPEMVFKNMQGDIYVKKASK